MSLPAKAQPMEVFKGTKEVHCAEVEEMRLDRMLENVERRAQRDGTLLSITCDDQANQ